MMQMYGCSSLSWQFVDQTYQYWPRVDFIFIIKKFLREKFIVLSECAILCTCYVLWPNATLASLLFVYITAVLKTDFKAIELGHQKLTMQRDELDQLVASLRREVEAKESSACNLREMLARVLATMSSLSRDIRSAVTETHQLMPPDSSEPNCEESWSNCCVILYCSLVGRKIGLWNSMVEI